jgi:peroxiredoxin Q/BCP
MVSLDPPERNRAFAESVGASPTVLSDPEGAAARAFGVLHRNGTMARRVSFVIDRTGVIRAIDTAVKPETHGRDLLDLLGTLGFEGDADEAKPAD